MISIVIPTHNESKIIRENLERVLAFLRRARTPHAADAHFYDRRNGRLMAAAARDWDWRVIVADNGSTDATRAIVRDIATREPRVTLLEIPEPGKGGAVIAAWQRALIESGIKNLESGDVYSFLDADLATDLSALPALIAAIQNGADVATGSRYAPGAQVERSWSRQVVSWSYRGILRLLFNLRVSDPPCGFKAVSARVVRDIVPLVQDRHWFFDTELLIRAQRAGVRIIEIPVTWREPRRGTSLHKVLRIIAHNLRAMWCLHRTRNREYRRSPLSPCSRS